MNKKEQINVSLFIEILALIISIGAIVVLHAIFQFKIIIMWGLLVGIILIFIKTMWKYFKN